MKFTVERIDPDYGSSFKLMEISSPSNHFFWHAHPEYEICFVKKGSGKRHIGSNISKYFDGDLVFIGPNIPHLGFGYGHDQDKNHEEIVIQLKENFLGKDFLNVPEFDEIRRLFNLSKKGVCFSGKSKKEIGQMIAELPRKNRFERLVSLISIFQKMAESTDIQVLNKDNLKLDTGTRNEERIRKIHDYVLEHFKEEVGVEQIAEELNLTVPSFCRYFKQTLNMTFTDFLNEFRVQQARALLQTSMNVSEVSFECGFNNLSHFDKTFKKITGSSPSDYRKQLINF